MSISTYSGAERRSGITGRIRSWLTERECRSSEGRDLPRLETFNDHLLRDIGLQRCPSGNHRRHLMRF
ncbi:hypothetical protein [Mesorhizobium sp. WSM2239]|uniref:DUF1127 domain-containing protein n=2 Tax=unclassified Mesorhizobium TaxID=325217 RepID=A0AAU8D813_9HYPH